uniref:Ig-like domain-containing protein n=1 Tax=Labrus bergylta TaxID=56723 RepID=A0A3Q3FV62_9LABR
MRALGLFFLCLTALMSVKTTVGGVEGQTFTFRCQYPGDYRIKAKYFCLDVDDTCSMSIIQTDKHEQWVEKGRYSMYDNTTAAFFIVRVDKLTLEDSGTYRCLKLIQTTNQERNVEKDRFKIRDNQRLNYFSVNIRFLSTDDSGTYWCGSDTTWRAQDTYCVPFMPPSTHPQTSSTTPPSTPTRTLSVSAQAKTHFLTQI